MEPRDHFAEITTPRGSHVFLQGLTEAQASTIAAQFAEPDISQDVVAEWAGATKTCGRCQGAGHWYETVEVETPSGGKVTTEKRVNCRLCGGTGQVPDN